MPLLLVVVLASPVSLLGLVVPFSLQQRAAFHLFSYLTLKVRACFAAIWGTDDLVSSFDAVAVWRPWQSEVPPSPPPPTSARPRLSGEQVAQHGPLLNALCARMQQLLFWCWWHPMPWWFRWVVGGFEQPFERLRRLRWRTERGWFHIDQNPLLKPVSIFLFLFLL
jgi:hypothetical protein